MRLLRVSLVVAPFARYEIAHRRTVPQDVSLLIRLQIRAGRTNGQESGSTAEQLS